MQDAQTPAMSGPERSARQLFRMEARKLVRTPSDAASHVARLLAALDMPGAEAAQGALADLFSSTGPEGSPTKRFGLELVSARLAPHVLAAFDQQVVGPALHSPHPLATRWSVLAQPSVDIPTRARRCSPDDSRDIAAQALRALDADDAAGVSRFLDHCMTCHDNLAFMLVRRAVLKDGRNLPAAWESVSRALEQSPGSRA